MALFQSLNIFIVTSNSPVSIYIGLFVAAATVFPACYRGTTCGKADRPWQPYLVRGDHLRQHNLPQMVRGDQLWQGTNCGVTDHCVDNSINEVSSECKHTIAIAIVCGKQLTVVTSYVAIYEINNMML